MKKGHLSISTFVLFFIFMLSAHCKVFYGKTMLNQYIQRCQNTIRSWTIGQKQAREIYAVGSGAAVSYSSYFSSNINQYSIFIIAATKYRLDDNVGQTALCWAPSSCNRGQWIQVSSSQPQFWTGIVIQGRGDKDQWVTQLKIKYTLQGKIWNWVEDGKVFEGNTDRATKKMIQFQKPIYARSIRLVPQTWKEYMSLRFDAVYVDI